MMRKKLDETRDHGFPASEQEFYPSPTHETLQGTETKAAAATFVHTSIQTFSHLASATFEGCPVGHFLVFGRNPNLLSRNALLTIPWTQNQLFLHVPRAPNGVAYLQNSCLAPSMKPERKHPRDDNGHTTC